MIQMIRTAAFARPASHRRIGGLLDVLELWRQRRQLAALDDQALSDIGIDRDAAQAEANRPVWDVPQNWLR